MNMRNVRFDGQGTKRADTGQPWIEAWDGPETVFFGHDAMRGLQFRKDRATRRFLAIGLDTGACYGNLLTAFVHPDCTFVQKSAHKVYSPPDKPLQKFLPLKEQPCESHIEGFN